MGVSTQSTWGVSGCQQFQGVTGVSIVVSMGNPQARKRIKARDFEYLAKNTRFATIELVEEDFDMLMDKYTDGKMEEEDFIKVSPLPFLQDLRRRCMSSLRDSQIRKAKYPWQTCSSSSTCSAMASWRTTWSGSSTSSTQMGTRSSP